MANIAYMNSRRRHRYIAILLLFPAITLTAEAGVFPGGLNLTEDLQQEYWRVTYVVRPSLENGSVGVTAVLMGDVSNGAVWRHADIRSRRSTQTRPEAQDGFGQALRVAVHPQGWMISGGSGGGMRLSYEVTAPGPDPEGAGGVGIGSEAVYAPGKDLPDTGSIVDLQFRKRLRRKRGQIEWSSRCDHRSDIRRAHIVEDRCTVGRLWAQLPA